MKLVFFFLIFLFRVSAESGAICTSHELPGSVSLHKGHRAYSIFTQLLKRVEVGPIELCVWREETKESRVKVCCSPWEERVAIALSAYVLENFSDEALAGVLAHELGHILGEPDIGEAGEQKADAFAIKLVGEAFLKAAYLNHTNDERLANRRIIRAKELIKHRKSSQ